MSIEISDPGAGLGASPSFVDDLGHGSLQAWRVATRLLSVLAVAIACLSVPAYFRQVSDVCTGPECAPDQVSARSADALGWAGLSVEQFAGITTVLLVVSALPWFVTAFLIARGRPDDRFAHLASLALVLGGAFTMCGSVENGAPELLATIAALNYAEMVVFLLFLALFPDGRFVPRWTRWIVLIAALSALAMALSEHADVLGLLWFPIAGTLLGAQVYRYRRSSGPVQRRQTRMVLVSLALVLVVVVGMFALVEGLARESSLGPLRDLVLAPAATLVVALLPISIGVAILRHQLFDVDLVINRALVYGALTAFVIAGYVVIVGYVGALFRSEASLPVSIIATGLVATLFSPLRDRLQAVVNRLMYGQRDDPFAAMAALMWRLDLAQEPDAILPITVQAVRDALRLPYVAIESGGADEVRVESGAPGGRIVRFPLRHQHEVVGSLLVSPRPGEEAPGRGDRRLLDELARQIAVVLHANRLTTELLAARERLVTHREEERRRLRRDLHDGLGPQLASQMLLIDAATARIRNDPEATEGILGELKRATQESVIGIRTIVQDLRPPALDDLGLAVALKQAADRVRSDLMGVEVDLPDDLSGLPAAVEVATYHIARESLTNVVRHAKATVAQLSLYVDEEARLLTLQVDDDGVGIVERPEGKGHGAGLRSMRERVDELGGSLEIVSSPHGGTTVRAILPLGGEERP